LSGSGFTEPIASIPPGATVTRHVRVKGESGLVLAFEAGAQRVSLPEQGYFESSGYSVVVVVQPDLSASVESKTCWLCP
jgi:hypothetical protein